MKKKSTAPASDSESESDDEREVPVQRGAATLPKRKGEQAGRPAHADKRVKLPSVALLDGHFLKKLDLDQYLTNLQSLHAYYYCILYLSIAIVTVSMSRWVSVNKNVYLNVCMSVSL